MTSKLFATSLTFSMVFSCVTINVNFPEGAVQKAADDYVQELYRAKTKSENKNKETRVIPFELPSWLIPTATAAEVATQFRVDSERAKTLQKSQRGRLDQITTFKKQGFIGENKEGLLELRNSDKIKPLLLKKVTQLIDDENKDRKALYEEVVTLNSLDSDYLEKISKNFSKSFQSMTPSGSWIQTDDGQWTQKP